ncbi:MAG: crossover junction endodeoxyribonuclease RuvC [Candidatus Magasanikbacteria bacterium]
MASSSVNIRILGIDPGFGRIGWGVIESRGVDWKHVSHGCIMTNKKKDFVDRLDELHTELMEIIKTFSPSRAGVEDLFFYKNVTTAIKVGQARGVILLTLRQAGILIFECTPLQVKQAVTGYGKAEKRQVQKMVGMILEMPKKPIQDDAADALAVAITCGNSLGVPRK